MSEENLIFEKYITEIKMAEHKMFYSVSWMLGELSEDINIFESDKLEDIAKAIDLEKHQSLLQYLPSYIKRHQLMFYQPIRTEDDQTIRITIISDIDREGLLYASSMIEREFKRNPEGTMDVIRNRFIKV